jgi:hypothetical protein
MLSANQLYNLSECKCTFVDWINDQKAEFNYNIQNGKIKTLIPFITWLNQKYAKNKSADGSGLVDSLADIITKSGEKINQNDSTMVINDNISTTNLQGGKTILGLKRTTFYTIIGIAIVVTGIAIYVSSKNNNHN